MTEQVIIALITQAGALLTAVIVAIIQARKAREEASEALEDRKISEETIDTLKEEVSLLRSTPSSQCTCTPE